MSVAERFPMARVAAEAMDRERQRIDAAAEVEHPGIDLALRERDAMLAWWDAPSSTAGQSLRARIALLARRDRTAQLADDCCALRQTSEEHERRFAESLCAAYAVARMGARAAGMPNPMRSFRLQLAGRAFDDATVVDLGIGFAVLWEQLTDPTRPRR